MDTNEVYMLLTIVEKVIGHGSSFTHIRNAATDRLNEINAELDPNPPKAEEPTEEEPTEEESNAA